MKKLCEEAENNDGAFQIRYYYCIRSSVWTETMKTKINK